MFNKTKENIKWFLLTLLKRIDSIFKNGGNNWSSTRIMSVALVMIPLVVWAILSLITLEFLIPEFVSIWLIAGLTGKVYSKKLELNKDNKNV